MHKKQRTEKQYLAIDFGLKRIGLAVANSLTCNAKPLDTVHTDNPFKLPSELLRAIKEWQPNKLIMGMPYNAAGEESSMSKNIRRFAAILSEESGMPIEFIDESFSSHEAQQQLKHLRQSGVRNKRIDKASLDKVAAAILLQRWLDQQPS